MGIQELVTTCFSKYVDFQGRATRSEYWWWALFIGVVAVVVIALGAILMSDSSLPGIVVGLFYLAIILPSLAVLIRRLHDTDHSGWWVFIDFVPIIGPFWLLYLLVISGTPGPNRFGPGTP